MIQIIISYPYSFTPFPRTFIMKDNVINGRNPPCSPFPVIAFMDEEATGCINGVII